MLALTFKCCLQLLFVFFLCCIFLDEACLSFFSCHSDKILYVKLDDREDDEKKKKKKKGTTKKKNKKKKQKKTEKFLRAAYNEQTNYFQVM